MIQVIEVKTRKQQKEFLDFPLKLYKDNPCFVPPLYGDEKKMFRPDYVYYDTCEAACWNAYRDGKMVGRIQGILQKAHNEKTGEKRIRFTRFDAIDDQAVADALFAAVENWAREKGMGNLQQEKSKNYATEGLTLRCKFWPNSKSKSKSNIRICRLAHPT